MTYPRSHLIDPKQVGYYHLISRCVRRAKLCGNDPLTGRNFDHRRQWIEDRILSLGDIFSVAIYGYAVLSNHYHIAIKVDPLATSKWSDQEVASRWLQLCPPKRKGVIDDVLREQRIKELLQRPERLQVLRQRLGSLSWFMRFINESIARLANQEDQCTGRFWEGRFNSQVLLDETSLLTCMTYVDLNPIRAGLTGRLESSEHTSIKRRIEMSSRHKPLLKTALRPLATGTPEAGSDLSLSVFDYITLVEWTALSQSAQRRAIAPQQPISEILTRIAQDDDTWLVNYAAQRNRYQRAFGTANRLKAFAKKIGQQWIQCRHKRPMPLVTG